MRISLDQKRKPIFLFFLKKWIYYALLDSITKGINFKSILGE
jgi:hypothetical protein